MSSVATTSSSRLEGAPSDGRRGEASDAVATAVSGRDVRSSIHMDQVSLRVDDENKGAQDCYT
jgi:hypothetical protein